MNNYCMFHVIWNEIWGQITINFLNLLGKLPTTNPVFYQKNVSKIHEKGMFVEEKTLETSLTLPKTNSLPLKIGPTCPKREKVVSFFTSIFRRYLLVLGRGTTLPPKIMEVENGIEDVFSLQMGYFPLPWLWEEEYGIVILPIVEAGGLGWEKMCL